ncbi:MAG: SPFH domain-containing protein [Planctomycetales bacterium]|jgi:regulator of protease activity HflC (stomatin/prohibitin superfamily)
MPDDPFSNFTLPGRVRLNGKNQRNLAKSLAGVVGLLVLGVAIYHNCRIDVGTGEMAILTVKTGLDITNGDEVAPSLNHKGSQAVFLMEGRYFMNPFDEGPRFFNPYDWDWDVIPQTTIPEGKLGILISLVGEDPGYGEFLGAVDKTVAGAGNQIGTPVRKGIIPDVLIPGRYAINPNLFHLEIGEPVTIEAGYRGVVTNLAGRLPEKPNELLVQPGERGVQQETLQEGTQQVNPYVQRISKVDCRSQRFNLAEKKDMGFPSKDGFWVSLDGRIQFRVIPDQAAEVYVIYNEDENGDAIDEEIIRKVIMPNARSFCRLAGSDKLGKDFIEGETRMEFETSFQTAMQEACEPLGIEIQEALITRIHPPEQIAEPIQQRENSRLEEQKYQSQITQQEAEQKLAIDKAEAIQISALVVIEQEIIKFVTEAMREQEVAKTKASEKLAVATLKLDAAEDEAEAITARGRATADVIGYENKADAAGWKRAVEAFDGNGDAYAQFVLYQKLASAYRRIMVNTADSPIMRMFESVSEDASRNSLDAPQANSRPGAAVNRVSSSAALE